MWQDKPTTNRIHRLVFRCGKISLGLMIIGLIATACIPDEANSTSTAQPSTTTPTLNTMIPPPPTPTTAPSEEAAAPTLPITINNLDQLEMTTALIGFRGILDGVLWSSDGQYLAGATFEDLHNGTTAGRVLLWDVSRKELYATLDGEESAVMASFNPQSTKLAVGWQGDLGIDIWDIEAKSTEQTLIGRERISWGFAINGRVAAISPNWEIVAMQLYQEESIVLRDLQTGDSIRTLPGKGTVLSLRWSPQGDRLIAGFEGGGSIIWDVETGDQLLILNGHSFPVASVDWSPDGSHVVTAARYEVFVWDSATGELLFSLNSGHFWAKARYLWDGSVIVVNDMTWESPVTTATDENINIQFYDAATGILLAEIPDAHDVVFSPDSRIAAIIANDGTLSLWEVLQP